MTRSDSTQAPLGDVTPRKTRSSVGRLAGAAALVGGLTLGGLALTHGGTGTVAASAGAGTKVLANGTPSTTPGGRRGFGHGFSPGFGQAGQRGGGLTVTGVSSSGTTITATNRGGQTVTITVDSNTKYTEAGAVVTLAAIQKGAHITVQGAGAGQTALTATSIEIVLPEVSGVVSSATSSTITLTGRNGTTQRVTLTAGTRYQEAGQSVSAAAIADGMTIMAEGTTNSDGSLSAELVAIQLPRVVGQVTATGSDSYTVSSRFGNSTYTVTTSSSTVYVTAAGASVQPSTITSGTTIMAEGTLSADGKTLSASRIEVLPAGAPGGHGGGFGMHVPGVAGQVTAVGTNSYTVSGRGGKTYTVDTTSSTVYVTPTGSSAQAGAIKDGVTIMAQGTLGADGKTLTATKIVILPASSGGHRGFGFGHMAGAPSGATATPTPSI